MNKGFNKGAQGGFTLIELIVVIVILGILAATALPKFTSLSGDARAASLQAARGAVSSASTMLHGKWLITKEDPITVEGGVQIQMLSTGYPESASMAAAAGLSSNDYTITGAGTQTLTIRPKGAPAVATCVLTYGEPTAANGGAPIITIDASKCE